MFDKNHLKCKSNKLDILSICQILTPKLFLPIQFSTAIGAISTAFLFSQSVVAQSFEGYCISQENKEELIAQKSLALLQATPDFQVIAQEGDREYAISLDPVSRRKLLLTQAGKQDPISQMILAPEGGKITNLALGDDNWLWIDRSAVDYMMKINLSSDVPYFESPTKLPELSAKPCYFLKRLFGKCRPGTYSYSSSLNRVFIGGYPIKSWRKKNYLHLEFIAGNQKPAPESLIKAQFVADIPEWNGALFRQPSGEALFYDGNNVINLSKDFLQLNNGEKFRDWEVRRTAGGRSFLGKFTGRTKNDPLFLMELNSQPGFTPVYLPEDLDEKWLEPIAFPDDSENILWIVTRKAVFAEVRQKMQTIIDVPSPFFIRRLKESNLGFVNPEGDKSLLFTVKKSKTNPGTNYILQKTVATENCDTAIDFNRSITLEAE